ncbi:hypothetical protein KOI35_26230 [Actinoplanes bogorensis]|uniref:Uncharacterized protein n=1 Tax=Paractinoplanes bogorensis TaxID=1610840 RepID=A0ABS5YU82_9ACTN|nr:hypothetical protein [Actinoplanes bogorensis]MBU2667015.1 hypothetical protein [Actinoplanes bogorensis]
MAAGVTGPEGRVEGAGAAGVGLPVGAVATAAPSPAGRRCHVVAATSAIKATIPSRAVYRAHETIASLQDAALVGRATHEPAECRSQAAADGGWTTARPGGPIG